MKEAFPKTLLPDFQHIDPKQIKDNINDLLNKNLTMIDKLLEQNGSYFGDNLMQPLEDMSDALHKTWSPVAHLHSVKETEALRKAYNETLPLITAYHTRLSQNTRLFEAISSIAERTDFKKLLPAQQKIIENDIRDFKLAGVHLSPEKKSRMAELQQQLSKLCTKFSENLLDATHGWTLHVTDENDISGLPPQARQLAIDNAKQRKLPGYVFTLDFPSYSTAVKFLDNRELRQKLYAAYTTRASDQGPNAGKWDNTHNIEAILKTRYDTAKLIGHESFAHYSLATKMAKQPEKVLSFLNDLLQRSKPIAKKEFDEIKTYAKKRDDIDDIAAWDVAYYSEKLQHEKFDFTQEDFRPYFPINKVLNGLFTLVNRIYGIHIKEEKNISTWDPQTRFFALYDSNDELRAGFYIDLFSRQHKRDGAWMDECLTRRKLSDGSIQYPVAYLTCNFMRPVDDQPALLTHDDVITLFHEFGHCLHHMLTKVDFLSISGINGVPWDAVEFPSQFMENFCWEKEPLSLISAHYKTGESLPDALYQKMVDAKHFQTGIQMIRQLEFALFDFRLHLAFDPDQPPQTQKILDEIRKETAVLKPPAFNRFQHSFAHIFAGGYAAGYYSYKWAEVLSADAYAQFEENGIFDPLTGKSFMENILEVGGSRDPMTSFVAFKGREPSIDALLRRSGIG